MSSTERKAFVNRRTSTATERAAYRAKREAERKAFWQSPEGQAMQERVAQAHREYMAQQADE